MSPSKQMLPLCVLGIQVNTLTLPLNLSLLRIQSISKCLYIHNAQILLLSHYLHCYLFGLHYYNSLLGEL